MMSDDYFSIHAVRPWDDTEEPVRQGTHRPQSAKKRKEMEQCFTCPYPDCVWYCPINGGDKLLRRQSESEDPCTGCYSKSICERKGLICNTKARAGKREEEDG
jgi:hypothetical protein